MGRGLKLMRRLEVRYAIIGSISVRGENNIHADDDGRQEINKCNVRQHKYAQAQLTISNEAAAYIGNLRHIAWDGPVPFWH